MAITTIKLSTSVKHRLDRLKSHKRETFEDVILRLVNIAEDEPELDEEEIRQIQASLEDIKHGRVLPFDEAKKKW